MTLREIKEGPLGNRNPPIETNKRKIGSRLIIRKPRFTGASILNNAEIKDTKENERLEEFSP
jgi:hypothetical protein